MPNELLIAIGGLVLSVLTYFAGAYRADLRHNKEDRDGRIQRVFDAYMAFRRTNQTGGIDGLQKAGVATLSSRDEIIHLIELIVNHGERHPLGNDFETEFSGVNLPKFFKYAATNRVNFHLTSVQEVINASGSKT